MNQKNNTLIFGLLLTSTILFQSTYAQDVPTEPVETSGSIIGYFLNTNGVSATTITKKNIEVSGQGSGSFDLTKPGSYSVDEGGGRSTEIQTTSKGEIIIRQPGANITTITPTPDGGLIVQGAGNSRFVVTPEGSVKGYGKNNRYTRVTTSSDGQSVTIWGRGGRIYSIPMPSKR